MVRQYLISAHLEVIKKRGRKKGTTNPKPNSSPINVNLSDTEEINDTSEYMDTSDVNDTAEMVEMPESAQSVESI